MRVVIETHVFVSALLAPGSRTAELITGWRQGRFTVLTSAAQLEELARVTRYPKIRERSSAPLVGRLVKELKGLAEWVEDLPTVDGSPDPFDNDLLSIAQGGGADYRVTDDRRRSVEPGAAWRHLDRWHQCVSGHAQNPDNTPQ